MPRGRKPKPSNLRILEGNPGKRPTNRHEAKPAPEIPSCPSWMDAAAKREWRSVVPRLSKLGLLARIDRATLAAYCQAYSRMVAAQKAIATGGMIAIAPSGYEMQAPAVGIFNKALEQVRVLSAEFGMTPSARSRIEVSTPSDAPQEGSAESDYLRASSDAKRPRSA